MIRLLLRSVIAIFFRSSCSIVSRIVALPCGSLSARVDGRHGYALLFVESLLRKFSRRLLGTEKCVLTFCFLKEYRIC